MNKSGLLFLCIASTFVFLNEKCAEVHGSVCETDQECTGASYKQFCCRSRAFWRRKSCMSSCIGQYCVKDVDCRGPNECCDVLNRCTIFGCSDECSTNEDCKLGKYCCKKQAITEKSVCLTDCIGEFCHSDIDCGGSEECCSLLNHCTTYGCRHECMSNGDCENGTFCCVKGHEFDKNSCLASCLGESCRYDSNCGSIGLCCGSNYICTNKCDAKSRGLGGWIIATIVTSACFIAAIVVVLGIFFVQWIKQKTSLQGPMVIFSPGRKTVSIPASSKAQNTYRRPPPLPPVLNHQPFTPPTSKTLSSYERPPLAVKPKSQQQCSPPNKTISKDRRTPPPIPPGQNHQPSTPPPNKTLTSCDRPPVAIKPKSQRQCSPTDKIFSKDYPMPPPLSPGQKPLTPPHNKTFNSHERPPLAVKPKSKRQCSPPGNSFSKDRRTPPPLPQDQKFFTPPHNKTLNSHERPLLPVKPKSQRQYSPPDNTLDKDRRTPPPLPQGQDPQPFTPPPNKTLNSHKRPPLPVKPKSQRQCSPPGNTLGEDRRTPPPLPQGQDPQPFTQPPKKTLNSHERPPLAIKPKSQRQCSSPGNTIGKDRRTSPPLPGTKKPNRVGTPPPSVTLGKRPPHRPPPPAVAVISRDQRSTMPANSRVTGGKDQRPKTLPRPSGIREL